MADEIITEELTEEEELANLSEQHRIRIEKLNKLKADGKDPYITTKFPVDTLAKTIRDNYDSMENQTVAIAGRMMTRRIMGKASFADVRDGSDRMQIYVRIDEVGKDVFDEFKTWDLGDIVGVTAPELGRQILRDASASKASAQVSIP